MNGEQEVEEVLNFCIITDNPWGMPWVEWIPGEFARIMAEDALYSR